MENEILNRKSPEQNEGEASEKYLAAENQTPRSMARKLSNVKALIKANIQSYPALRPPSNFKARTALRVPQVNMCTSSGPMPSERPSLSPSQQDFQEKDAERLERTARRKKGGDAMCRSSDQVFGKAQAFDEMKSSSSSHLAKSESSKIMLPSKHPPSILPHHSIFLQHLSAHSSEEQERLKDGASDKQNLTEDTEQKPARWRSTKKQPLVDFAAVMLLSSEEASASNRNKSNAADTSFDCEHELQREQEHQLLGCDKLNIQGGERSQMITGNHLKRFSEICPKP